MTHSRSTVVFTPPRRLPCPLRGFDGCGGGRVESSGFVDVVSHLQKFHRLVERKLVVRDILLSNEDVFAAFGGVLETLCKWLCGSCMRIHAVSRRCVHLHGDVVSATDEEGSIIAHIIGISRPVARAQVTDGVEDCLVFDTELLDKVFRAPVTTVKSIPLSCRLSFSHALKDALQRVVDEPSSVAAWVKLLILPRCTLQVFMPLNRRERRSAGRKSIQSVRIRQALVTWGEEDGIARLVRSLLEGTVLDTSSRDRVCDDRGDSMCDNPNIKQCLRKVSDGHFSAAVKVLSSSGVAPFDSDTLEALEAKHPIKALPTLTRSCPQDPPLISDFEGIFKCIKSFPKGTSCGRDGLRAQHLLDSLCGEGSAVCTEIIRAITLVVNLWLGGRCPPSLAEFVASAPLTPLLKPNKEIRPIAVGTIWRRLVSKIAMKGVCTDMARYLGDLQFGVGISGGAEAIVHSVNRFLMERHGDGSLAMLTVDFTNAFNLVDRTVMFSEVRERCSSISPWVEFLYGQKSRLYLGDRFIWSTTGVQQGDPLGPLLFALVLHPLLHKIRDNCQSFLHAWYLDDGTIIGQSEEVARALSIIREFGPISGLVLNVSKTEIFWPTCDGSKLRDGLFPIDIARPAIGVKLLGGAVSMNEEFISDLVMTRAVKAVQLMRLLPQLKDPQSELLLLRSCMGVAKMYFGLRTCHPDHVKGATSHFDSGLREAIEGIVVSGGPFFGDLQWRLASLPIRYGGFGVYSSAEASSFAFAASRAQSWGLQDLILRDSDLSNLDFAFGKALDLLQPLIPSFDLSSFRNKDTVPPRAQHVLACALFEKTVLEMEAKFDLTHRQRVVFKCLQAAHAQDFLLTIPIEGLGQCMSPIEFRTILKYRLMIPLFPMDEICPMPNCRMILDSFGEHAVHCKERPGFKYRHDLVRDVLFDIFKRAGISAKKEAPVSFLTDPLEGRSTLRPADVLVFGWDRGKHVCIDITGVSPLVGLGSGPFVVGQAANKAAVAKVAKHEKACIENQHAFLPFAFDTFGFLAPDAVDTIKRVHNIMSGNTVFSNSVSDIIFRRIGFAIQKGVAAQLVARLPSTLL